MSMTPKRIKELRRLCNEATPGPWRACQLIGFGAMRFVVTDAEKAQWYQVVAILQNPGSFAGDEFIAASRTAMPEALDEIERLRAELEAYKQTGRAP
jgi:carbamoylphosphate synthase large subunit